MNSNDVHLVRVTTDDGEGRLWAAATLREEAAGRVLEVIPEGWSARLLDEHLKARQDVIRSMRPGELRDLSE